MACKDQICVHLNGFPQDGQVTTTGNDAPLSCGTVSGRARFATLPRLPLVLWVLVVATAIQVRSVAGDDEKSVEVPVDPGLQSLISKVAVQVIPCSYEDRKKWGKQKKIQHGLYMKRDGLRLRTHRTWKSVNHGTWSRYHIQLKNPDEQFEVQLNHVQLKPDGHTEFEILCVANLNVFGRVSQWQHGVQLASVSADADADVKLTMQCSLAMKWESSDALPTLVLEPVVRDADLQIRKFKLNRVSQAKGPLVRQLSSSVREILEDQIEKRRTKIVAKINRQIDKKRDKLRLSLSDWLKKETTQKDEEKKTDDEKKK